eukprot:NODE_9277_length_324_cov_59.872727_g7511_i0.p4 GENE.NODE_9277_length_324_cov_59.872727_g7511_i0~~NODE_9277_length_324_cov_59.872727_g7511_i0.p4  ORF type:complete len:55 (-),score=30.08 NODE_9277_length_324_cov_59.872727_g7511_i0:159-293(-)
MGDALKALEFVLDSEDMARIDQDGAKLHHRQYWATELQGNVTGE